MTKEVMIRIVGNQKLDGVDEPAESVALETKGTYYLKNNRHYVIYEESCEEISPTTKNTLKIHEQGVDLNKHGITNVHMLFEKNKKNLTTYQTPFGSLMMGIETGVLEIKEEADQILVRLEYVLEIDDRKHADCELSIEISSI